MFLWRRSCPLGGFPGGSAVKRLPSRRSGFDPWVRKIPWRRKQQPTLVFVPGNPMDRQAWRSIGLQKSQTRLKRLNNMLSSAEYMLNMIVIVLLYTRRLIIFFPQNYISNVIHSIIKQLFTEDLLCSRPWKSLHQR